LCASQNILQGENIFDVKFILVLLMMTKGVHKMKTPACIGIENIEGQMVPLIPKDSETPIQRKIIAFANEDNLTNVMINILYGNNYCAPDNVSVGKLILKDIPSLPKSKQQIEISVTLLPNMLLDVSASAVKSNVKAEMNNLDLSSITTPDAIERSNLSNIEEMYIDVMNLPSLTIGDSNYSNDLHKAVYRFYFNKAFHGLLLNKTYSVLLDYSLTQEQLKALEILNSPNLMDFPLGGVILAIEKIANYYNLHPNAKLCPTCNGFGYLNNEKKFFGASFVNTKNCPTCGGNCCISIN
jgi:hypothetical protein